MYQVPDDEKKRVIEKRIVRELTQFHKEHGKGLSMQMLAAKYSRALSELGGFPEFIESMRERGLIVVEYAEHGARTVLPGTGEVAPLEKKIQWY